jgi:hypothetical protein
MALTAAEGKLSMAVRTLLQRWDATKAQWHDSVSRDFEENHLAPLEKQITVTLRAIERLAHDLQKARQECT